MEWRSHGVVGPNFETPSITPSAILRSRADIGIYLRNALGGRRIRGPVHEVHDKGNGGDHEYEVDEASSNVREQANDPNYDENNADDSEHNK